MELSHMAQRSAKKGAGKSVPTEGSRHAVRWPWTVGGAMGELAAAEGKDSHRKNHWDLIAARSYRRIRKRSRCSWEKTSLKK